jgi:hypothetical protein
MSAHFNASMHVDCARPGTNRLRRHVALLGLIVGALVGCVEKTPLQTCGNDATTAVRLRAKDAQSGALLPNLNLSISATLVGTPGYTVGIFKAQDDSTLILLRGPGGVYDVTLTGPGYAQVSQQITVTSGDACLGPTPVDAIVVLPRAP